MITLDRKTQLHNSVAQVFIPYDSEKLQSWFEAEAFSLPTLDPCKGELVVWGLECSWGLLFPSPTARDTSSLVLPTLASLKA